MARYGHVYLEAMLSSWWTWACRRHRPVDPLDEELSRVAARAGAAAPSAALRMWLAEVDPDTVVDQLTPQQAGHWLAARRQMFLSARRHRLPAGRRGPTAARAPPAVADRVGRHLVHPFHRLEGLRDDQGEWHSRPDDVLGMLWRSRSPWWGSDPPLPARIGPLLQDYARSHAADLSGLQVPSYGAIADHVLRAGGLRPARTTGRTSCSTPASTSSSFSSTWRSASPCCRAATCPW